MRQHVRRNHFVVGGEFALGDSVIGKHHLLGVGDHDRSRTTSRAVLSSRKPMKRPCRSFPCVVHSMNATCTTTSGLTQCARMRGRPAALVKGLLGISISLSRARNPSNCCVSKPVPTLPAKTN